MPVGRCIIRLDDAGVSVAREARFETEARLHNAIAAHPEVLPHDDFGLRPLVPLAKELDLGAGPMDLLAADGQGQLVIVEFKRGSENPDVRQVVAQILEYGAALWRYDYENLEAQCSRLPSVVRGSLVEHVGQRLADLDEPFEPEAFQAGARACLDSGAFVFVYCGRDLDDRTRRIMTYLAEGPLMRFFAVEVDYYWEGAGEAAVLVPRTAFVPSWITGPTSATRSSTRAKPGLADAPPEFGEVVARMDEVAREMGLAVRRRSTGRSYLPPVLEEGVEYATDGVGVYWTSRGVQINLTALRDLGLGELADALLARLEAISGTSVRKAPKWPAVPCASLLQNWDRARGEVIEPYFRARMDAATSQEVRKHEPVT